MIANHDLERMIRLGEDSSVELKRVLLQGSKFIGPRRAAMAGVVAGMANCRGGTIVLGVDDKNTRSTGYSLDKLDTVERWMSEIYLDSLKPPTNA